MRIRDLLQDNLVIEEIEATDKNGVVREFAVMLKSAGKLQDEDAAARILLERESLGSTGIGDGVAIPHGKIRGLKEMVVSFGRSKKGVDFQALDGKPVYLFFLLLTPDDNPGEHLRTLARISRILKNPVLRGDLRNAEGGADLQRIILEEDGKYPQK
ncbi:MAG: PTS fructose transporter subunit IIA [Nitrospirae bacterium GWC2_57_13]|nr:MAG: PTS fructose transporter subunit IIA [Nitrospirae bacterium GWC2_57_13]OGW41510.1 MAG: PTS fructose transporter subunit IIA [Nitrospirae bacterium GWD2_57_8]HAR46057.1 PTS fructose transporter subunit IIA [Nitrospiraceae bacterium]